MPEYNLSSAVDATDLKKTAETTSSRLVEMYVSCQLAEYLANPKLHPLVKLQILDIARASSSGEPKPIHSRLLIAAISRRTFNRFLKAAYELEELGIMKINQSYCPRQFQSCEGWCKTYSISSPQTTVHSHSAQHIINGTGLVGGGWVVVDMGLLDDCLSKGRKKLNWVSVEATRASLPQVTLVNVPVDDSELRAAAETHIREKTPRIKPEELAVKVDRQVTAIRKAALNPAGGRITRKSGRIYHRLNNLPKWARSLYVRICGEVPANVDIRCCYLWCLLANLRRSRMAAGLPVDHLDAILDMIESGKFYEKLATLAGMSTRGAKASFATLCLFGGEKENFANNRLWYALKELCPAICKQILRLRERHGGASGFAKHCQRLEGVIMLDGLIVTLHGMGIPCVGLHDGALVQPQYRQLAIDIIRARSLEVFGRACHVSG